MTPRCHSKAVDILGIAGKLRRPDQVVLPKGPRDERTRHRPLSTKPGPIGRRPSQGRRADPTPGRTALSSLERPRPDCFSTLELLSARLAPRRHDGALGTLRRRHATTPWPTASQRSKTLRFWPQEVAVLGSGGNSLPPPHPARERTYRASNRGGPTGMDAARARLMPPRTTDRAGWLFRWDIAANQFPSPRIPSLVCLSSR